MTRLRREADATVVAADAVVDDVLLRTLEPAVGALDRLFDPTVSAPSDDGDPDGFDGLDTRGPLEHLLATEWLLASEEPDEFLRRYEHHELGFLRTHRVGRRRPQTALVLFDTGPAQLGRPRIAQLACLVVLARRAARVGAELRWGTLQSGARHLAGEPETAVRFLAARRVVAPPGELPLDALVDDALVVTPTPWPDAARQLVLTEDGDVVRAELVDRRRGTTRRGIVPMPGDDDAVRVLRDPIGARPGEPTRSRHAPTSNLVFDETGDKVLARVEPNRLAIYAVPGSPAEKPGRTRSVRTPPELGPIVAAGRIRRSVLTVNVVGGGTSVVVSSFGGRVHGPTGTYPLRGGPLPPLGDDPPLGGLSWVHSLAALCVHLPEHRLTQGSGSYRIDRADRSFRSGSAGFDVSAQPEEGGWVIRHGTDEWRWTEGPVIGVYLRGSEPCALVLLDGTRVGAVGPNGHSEVLHAAGEPIVDATAHDARRRVALRTASGRIVVVDRDTGTVFTEVQPWA